MTRSMARSKPDPQAKPCDRAQGATTGSTKMTRSMARTKRDPQAKARHPAQGATTEAKPAPKMDPARVVSVVGWLTEVARDLNVRQCNLEAVIARAPGVRQVLRALPRNLKALAPTQVPFDARLWARGDPAERSRLATAVAWYRDHPGSSVADAARACDVLVDSLRVTPAMRELLRRLPGPKHGTGPNGGTQRALRALARHRPASIAEVARAVGVNASALSWSRRFRKAWAEYASTAKVNPVSRARFGRPLRRHSARGSA